MVEIETGPSGGKGIGNATSAPKHPGMHPTAGTLLEVALIVAIVVEAGMMAYFYRAKLTDFFQPFAAGSKTEEVTPPPGVSASPEAARVSPSPAITPTLPSAAVVTGTEEMTVTPVQTSIPVMAGENNGSATPGIQSTPPSKGNNGNHYGQTPKPQRTKENSGKNDKPPKDDDKPPKDKPTKDKPPKKK
ncbi:MAG TPA: hypothetical protein VKP08_14505 [Anaerolineales bacterium]|nr:hypothetical protein [Anaerolineales bacterium]